MALDMSAAPAASGHAPEKSTTMAKLMARSEKSSAGGGPSGSVASCATRAAPGGWRMAVQSSPPSLETCLTSRSSASSATICTKSSSMQSSEAAPRRSRQTSSTSPLAGAKRRTPLTPLSIAR